MEAVNIEPATELTGDFSVWSPRLRLGEFNIVFVGVKGKDKPPEFSSPVVQEAPCSTGALAEPTDYTCIWSSAFNIIDGGEQPPPFSFWRPNCPVGYVSLSDIGNFKFRCDASSVLPANAPEVAENAFRCVHQNLTIETDYGYPVWIPRDIAEFPIENRARIVSISDRRDGIRVEGSGGGRNDDNVQRRLSNIPVSLLFKALNEVLTLSNPSATEQKMTFSLQRGLESTRSKETTESTEFRSDFSLKVGTGEAIAFVGSAEFTASFGTTSLTGTTVSQSDVTSVLQTTTIDVTVPPFSLARLAQVVVLDSPLGSAASATQLYTSHYALKFEPLNSTDANSNSTGIDSGTDGTPGNSALCNHILAGLAEITGLQNATNDLLAATETRLRTATMTLEQNNGHLLDILDNDGKEMELLDKILKQANTSGLDSLTMTVKQNNVLLRDFLDNDGMVLGKIEENNGLLLDILDNDGKEEKLLEKILKQTSDSKNTNGSGKGKKGGRRN